MKQCHRLDEVRFTWISISNGWAEFRGLLREYDAMLKLFQDVRGVGQVIFTEVFTEDGPNKVNKWLDGWSDLGLASEGVRKAVKASMESPPP